MKIRQYIVDQITSHGNEPVVFPSTRKLAEMFGVSQPTARRAVRDLITDGYLEPLKSGGTISLRRDSADRRSTRIFGTLIISGDQTFLHHYALWLLSELGLELTGRSLRYQLQNLLLESPSLLERAVRDADLSGLLLIAPRSSFAEPVLALRRQGLAVVGLMADFPGISCARVDYRQLMITVLGRLFREGRTRVVINDLPDSDRNEAMRAGIADACREANIPPGQVILLDTSHQSNHDRLRELLDFGLKPDAVIFLMMNHFIYELLSERLDIRSECRLVCVSDVVRRDMNFTGEVVHTDIAGVVPKLVDNLLEQEAPDAPVLRETIGFGLYEYQEGTRKEKVRL